MAFFNKKEDVLQLKLTQHGKRLLAEGKLKPAYYAFFDDAVLYNSEFASFSEHQDATEERIQENTPSLKTQHIYYGAETSLKTITKKRNSLSYGESETEKYFTEPIEHGFTFVSSPIGTSDLAEEKAPAFTVSLLDGLLTGSIHYVTGAFQTLKIPQLDVELEYVVHIANENGTTAQRPKLSYRSQIDLGQNYEDGSTILIEEDLLMLEVEEHLKEYTNENFDIEVFLVEEEDISSRVTTPGITHTGKKEVLTPLSFKKKRQPVVNNVLLDDDDIFLRFENVPIDSSYVEHFFDIFVDHEIDPEAFCLIKKTEATRSYMEQLDIECKDDLPSSVAVYDALSEQDPEDCE
jgi:hypothetical protein